MAGVVVCLLALGAGRADASWSAPGVFSTPGEVVDAPDAAANATGGAAIAWSHQIDSSTSSIEVSVRREGGTFTPAQVISLPDTGLNVDPSVAVGADGTVAVVWSQEDSTAVMSLGSVSGQTFSAPIALEPAPDADGPQYPYVAIDSTGDVFAAWTDQINVATDGGTDADTVIHYTDRPAGATGFGPIATLTSPNGQMDYPTFASAPSGNTIVTWSDAYAAVRPAGGRFGPAEHLDPGCVASGPDPAAIDSAGDAVVTWDSTADCDSGEPVTVQASYMPAGGSFGAAETVAQMGGYSAVTSVVMNQAGQPTVALAGTLRSPTENEGLTALTRSAPGTWGSPQTLVDTDGSASPPLGDDLVDATLGYDSGGDLYAAWDARAWNADGTVDSGIYAEIQPAGGSFDGSPAQVEETDGVLDTAPVLAGAGDVDALLAWTTGGSGHDATFGASGVDAEGGSDNSIGGPAAGSSTVGGSAGDEVSGGENRGAGTSSATPAIPTPPPAATTPRPSGPATPAPASRVRTIIVRGRAGHAESAIVKLIADRRVIARRRAEISHGRYAAELRVPSTLARRVRVQITLVTAHRRTTRSRVITT